MTPLFIAEVKTESPFGFKSERNWADLLDLAIEHADIVAVHTDERWGGSFGQLAAAAEQIRRIRIDERRPLLLAKGIHEHDSEVRMALNCGADLVLVVGRQPPRELVPACIWEPANGRALLDLQDPTMKVMWNARDLETGAPIPSALGPQWAREMHRGWLCQASFIRTPDDVNPLVNAFIVGEHLPTFVEAL